MTPGHLTVKLSGRAPAPDWSRGRILLSGARGDTTELHGPLQRLLEDCHCRQTKPPSSLGTASPRAGAQLQPRTKRSDERSRQCRMLSPAQRRNASVRGGPWHRDNPDGS
jgi:hypothetical protein